MLDTGTQVTIVDSSFIANFHLNTEGALTIIGVGSSESASMVRLEGLAIGSHAISDLKVLISDLTKLKSVNLQIKGILGEDFLQHFDMLIDNAHALLCLDETETMRGRIRGAHIPLLTLPQSIGGSSRKAPIVSVRFDNGIRLVRLLLDSGSNAPFLYDPSNYLAVGVGVFEGALQSAQGNIGPQQAFIALPPNDIQISDIELWHVSFLALRNQRKDLPEGGFDGLLPTGMFKRVFVSRSAEFGVLDPRF